MSGAAFSSEAQMTDILETLKAELVEAKETLRAAFPGNVAAEGLASSLRCWVYQNGRWPTTAEIRARYGERAESMERKRLEQERLAWEQKLACEPDAA
jgi:hypothetical protein